MRHLRRYVFSLAIGETFDIGLADVLGDPRLCLFPRWEAADLLPPATRKHEGGSARLVEQERVPSEIREVLGVVKPCEALRDEVRAPRQVLDIGERHLVTGKVLLLAEDDLVDGDLRLELALAVLDDLGVARVAGEQRHVDHVGDQGAHVHVEAGCLDGERLLEEHLLLEAVDGRERRLGLRADVLDDRGRIVQDDIAIHLRPTSTAVATTIERTTHQGRDGAEGVQRLVLGLLLLALGDADLDELEGRAGLLEHVNRLLRVD